MTLNTEKEINKNAERLATMFSNLAMEECNKVNDIQDKNLKKHHLVRVLDAMEIAYIGILMSVTAECRQIESFDRRAKFMRSCIQHNLDNPEMKTIEI